MRLTKLKKSKIELEPFKQPNKTLISNYQKNIKEPSNAILNQIIQKNSSFNDLKESIKKESNTNIKNIFSSDESRLKAIKYVIQSTNRDNQKNEQKKLRQNLSYISYDAPLTYNQKNNKKETIKNSFYKTIEKISPIKTTIHKPKFIKKNLDIYDSPMTVLFQRNRVNSNNVISQSEVNIQYLKNKTERNKNNLSENKASLKSNKENLFYHKVQYIKKNNNNNNKRERNNEIIYDYNKKDSEYKEERIRNRTINNFYVHKQINKSGIYENNDKTCNNNIKKYKNNNQGINVFYSTKNINYDIMYNFPENDSYNNHHENIPKDEYFNFPNYSNYPNKTFFNKKAKNKIHKSLYIPEDENESDTCPNESNFEKIFN